MSGWVAGAVAVGAIGGAYITSKGTQNAADTQAQSAQQANALQQQDFQTLQNNLQPYMQAGSNVLPQLQWQAGQTPAGYNSQFNYDPNKDPMYQFELQQGMQGIMDQQTALGGGLGGGNNLKALMQYGQGLAGQSYQQEFNNWLSQNSQALNQQQQAFNQLYGVAGMGQNAAAGVGQGAIQTGQNMGANITGAGNAAAAAQIAQGNIWGGTMQQLTSPTMMNSLQGYFAQQPSTLGPSYSDVTNGMGAYTYAGTAYNNPSAFVQ